MRFSITLVLILCMIFSAFTPSRAYTLQYTDSSASTQLRWSSNTITIALSTSLQSPPANIKAGSDCIGAAQRALAHWSEAANVQFIVTTSNLQSVSASGSGGDDVNLITVADTTDNRTFLPGNVETPGRTRAFNDDTHIVEADIVVNPALPFSTDGTPNTYDLESVLTHEIGHLLGLEHSGIISATMQPRFARNGLYGLPTTTPRTLSDDDRSGISAIYGARNDIGGIEGNIQISGMTSYGANVWAEEVTTGRVRGSNIALANGNYHIDGLPAGQYRLIVESLDEPVSVREIPSTIGAYGELLQNPPPSFRTYEAPGIFNVVATQGGATTEAVTFQNIAAPGGSPSINPTFVGRDGQLSTVAVPLVPGKKTTVFVGGTNLTQSQVSASGIQITSPFFTVDQSSVAYTQYPTSFGALPVISFDVTVSSIVPPGDYSIRLASNSGDFAYLAGALTIDLPFGVASGNPITDNSQFFVAQHYRDFLSREPDSAGLNFWTNQIASCNGDAQCVDIKRQNVSAAYFLSIEFQQTGYLVERFYKTAFGRVPRYLEFLPDTQSIGQGVVVTYDNANHYQELLEANKQAFAANFVARLAFRQRYDNATNAQFVDALIANTGARFNDADRSALIKGLSNSTETRASVLRKVAENQAFTTKEFNPAFVLMQYFGYLRRDPDANGYNFWLKKLNDFNGNYIQAEMVRSFIISNEYKQRFGK